MKNIFALIGAAVCLAVIAERAVGLTASLPQPVRVLFALDEAATLIPNVPDWLAGKDETEEDTVPSPPASTEPETVEQNCALTDSCDLSTPADFK